MKALSDRTGLAFAVVLLAVMGSTLALLVLPGSAHAQTRVPPLPTRLAPLRATPVTPDMACVHLTTDGAPGASFVGGAIKERCFAFPGDAGMAVTIVLKAATGAAPAMELRGPAGEVVARGKDGQITSQALTATGPYALIVSGANLPKPVRVEASVVAAGGMVRPAAPSGGDSGDVGAPAGLCRGVLRQGQSHTDLIPMPGVDCRYTFEGRRGQAVSVWMESRSDGLRPEIILLDPAGNVLDRGHAIDARTRYASAMSLPVSGVYTVVAGSQGGQSAGPFELRLSEGASATCGDALTIGMLTEVHLPGLGRSCTLTIDLPFSFSLQLNTWPLDGASPPAWRVSGPQGDIVRSSDDPYPGWNTGQTGTYTLRISPTSRQPQRMLVQVQPPPPKYYVWSTCGGELATGTATSMMAQSIVEAGALCLFTFDGTAGDMIWLAVSQTAFGGVEFEPVAELLAPGYQLGDAPEAVGDAGVFTGMSVIRDHALAHTGRYTVRVSDDGNDDTGRFYIRLWRW